MPKNEDKIQKTINIPGDLFEKISNQADKERRSINTMLIVMAEKYLKDISE